jgi:hypothetical protein
MVTPKEIIELIESLPNSEYHIYTNERGVTVTSEWLVGNFAGMGFVAAYERGCSTTVD